MEEKVDYYSMAIAWAENYLKENPDPKPFKYKQGETIDNDILFVSTSLERLKHNAGRERQASYNRIRIFKQFIEKTNTIGCLIK
jgi:hypothetical protein